MPGKVPAPVSGNGVPMPVPWPIKKGREVVLPNFNFDAAFEEQGRTMAVSGNAITLKSFRGDKTRTFAATAVNGKGDKSKPSVTSSEATLNRMDDRGKRKEQFDMGAMILEMKV